MVAPIAMASDLSVASGGGDGFGHFQRRSFNLGEDFDQFFSFCPLCFWSELGCCAMAPHCCASGTRLVTAMALRTLLAPRIVNKPYLPLASGEYSIGTGVGIVSLCSIMSFWLGWVVGSVPLLWALFISFVLGTAYSIDLPFLRWKRFASLSAMCIVSVRAVIILLAFYLHMQTSVFRRPAVFPRPLLFAIAIVSLFSVVIASFKDIPDIDGDSGFGIQSFAVRFGQKRVFWGCIALLELAYSVAIVVGMTSSCLWSKLITVCGHAALALILWNRAKSIDLEDKAAMTSCYMFIWKLLYAEYLLIPLVR